ncbi:MAG TPA: sigma factor-like helix-turn-helix DNA-binding protein [Candidatus Paceibacterota bacterium]|nr:sigma factor-like helix-turn-helix DNA-binding protein [Candidatus Paceibacterota bacterium]
MTADRNKKIAVKQGITLSFSPKAVSKDLLQGLPERARRVLIDRFGLAGTGKGRTLEAIGKEYGITRERVRQIESSGIASVRESSAYAQHGKTWEELKRVVHELGGALPESLILAEIAKNDQDRNHTLFLLTVGHHFGEKREDADFHRRWHVDASLMEAIEGALTKLYESIEPMALLSEDDFFDEFSRNLKDTGARARDVEIMRRWLALSKRLARNPLGEWGRVESPHVRIKNTRDFAYLTLKRHGSPMHFTEVARGIRELFRREAHPATTHNELIKDERFVLVGRGLYALKEWGYAPGVVRDVIRNILMRDGALTREEIIDRVKRERYVKDATIVVNLQHTEFKRDNEGKYIVSR